MTCHVFMLLSVKNRLKHIKKWTKMSVLLKTWYARTCLWKKNISVCIFFTYMNAYTDIYKHIHILIEQVWLNEIRYWLLRRSNSWWKSFCCDQFRRQTMNVKQSFSKVSVSFVNAICIFLPHRSFFDKTFTKVSIKKTVI